MLKHFEAAAMQWKLSSTVMLLHLARFGESNRCRQCLILCLRTVPLQHQGPGRTSLNPRQRPDDARVFALRCRRPWHPFHPPVAAFHTRMTC